MRALNEILSIESFVDHPKNYAVLTDFWKQTFFGLTGISGESYITNQFGNGQDILDGNPIFNAKISRDKGIRIIQFESASDQPVLSSWVNKTTINNVDFEELVIAIQLQSEPLADAEQLITLYFNQNLTEDILSDINHKYDVSSHLNHH